MYNPSGFNPQYLDMNDDLGDPRRQEKLPGGYATQGQAVSAPYAEANMKAAEKTNPMNAASQEPGMAFLDAYMQKSGMEQGKTASLSGSYDENDRKEDQAILDWMRQAGINKPRTIEEIERRMRRRSWD